MKRITGRLTEKNGRWYAVINLYTTEGKRKEKWHNIDLEAKKGSSQTIGFGCFLSFILQYSLSYNTIHSLEKN